MIQELIAAIKNEDQEEKISPTHIRTKICTCLSCMKERNHYQKHLHTVDSDRVVITEVHGIAMKAAEAFSILTE